ncbi:MAG TPA: hypothetical protein VGH02_07575 [Rhizomicrobium sp.]|jgi:hypothetical protein
MLRARIVFWHLFRKSSPLATLAHRTLLDFFAYWHSVVRDEINEYAAHGLPLIDPDAEQSRARRKRAGITFIRQYSLPELANVSASMPNATPAVIRQIQIWKALHCVVEKYDATKFFTNNGQSSMGMEWPYDSIMSVFAYDSSPVDPEKTKAYRLPNMLDLEPIDALGRFFHDAQAKGDLPFPDKDTEWYFFRRYETDEFYDMTDVSKARAWFRIPPWSANSPHLERPTRPIKPPADKAAPAIAPPQ